MDFEKFIKDMPDNLNDIEKARYIYLQLGKFFSYDEQYITSGTQEKRNELFYKDFKTIKDDKIVCATISDLYTYLLNRCGIKAKTIYFEKPPKERRKSKTFACYYRDKYRWRKISL